MNFTTTWRDPDVGDLIDRQLRMEDEMNGEEDFDDFDDLDDDALMRVIFESKKNMVSFGYVTIDTPHQTRSFSRFIPFRSLLSFVFF